MVDLHKSGGIGSASGVLSTCPRRSRAQARPTSGLRAQPGRRWSLRRLAPPGARELGSGRRSQLSVHGAAGKPRCARELTFAQVSTIAAPHPLPPSPPSDPPSSAIVSRLVKFIWMHEDGSFISCGSFFYFGGGGNTVIFLVFFFSWLVDFFWYGFRWRNGAEITFDSSEPWFWSSWWCEWINVIMNEIMSLVKTGSFLTGIR